LTDKVSNAVQRALLSNSPDIVISTPATAWHNINSSALSIDKLTHLILDEADLVLSYGYSEDLENLSRSVPKGVQVMMMSATLTDEVDTLKGIFRRDPTLLDLKEKEAEGEGITQFVAKYVLPIFRYKRPVANILLGVVKTRSSFLLTLSSSSS
jgi:ATP-dependent RNA helicase DDX56/DBP9